MLAVKEVLCGWQQSLFDDIEAYWLENSPARELVRQERIEKVGSNGWIYTTDGQHLNPRHFTPEQPQPKRREQVGWIEERISNPKRKTPTTCYYFGWYEMQDGERRKMKTYVPQAQMSEVWQSCKIDKRPYTETLKLIRKSGKAHHTQEPKL